MVMLMVGIGILHERTSMIPCTCPETRPTDLPAATAGDHEALARLVSVHRAQMQRSIARRIPAELRGLVDADDVIQETYLTAISSIRGFRPTGQGSFCRWLHTIARRRLSDLIKSQRRSKRRHTIASGGDDPLVYVSAHTDTPGILADRADATRLICDAMINLPPRQREALRLHYLQGSSLAIIPGHLGTSAGAISMLCTRALQRLRRALRE
jgi:RNA polymerase sigma-70 factor (ECF subfamily)